MPNITPHLIRGYSNAAKGGGGDTLVGFLTPFRVCRLHPSRCCVDTPYKQLNTFWGVKRNHQKRCQTPLDNTPRQITTMVYRQEEYTNK